VEFLSSLSIRGLAGGTIAGYSSAITETIRLASNGEADWGALPMLSRFRVSAALAAPPPPRPSEYWSVQDFLQFLVKMGPEELLPPLERRNRLLALLRVHWMCRSSDLSAKKFFRREVVHDSTSMQVRFYLPKEIKSSSIIRRGCYSEWLAVEPNHRFPSMDVSSLLLAYLEATWDPSHGPEAPVFLAATRTSDSDGPVRGLTADRISAVFKSLLADSGVDVTRFSAHSARGAASSFCAETAPALQQLVMETARWGSSGQSIARRSRTFLRHYYRSGSASPSEESIAEPTSVTEALWSSFSWVPHPQVSVEEFLSPALAWAATSEYPRVLGHTPPSARKRGLYRVVCAEGADELLWDHSQFIQRMGDAREARAGGP
jgi:hypothetical protein